MSKIITMIRSLIDPRVLKNGDSLSTGFGIITGDISIAASIFLLYSGFIVHITANDIVPEKKNIHGYI